MSPEALDIVAVITTVCLAAQLLLAAHGIIGREPASVGGGIAIAAMADVILGLSALVGGQFTTGYYVLAVGGQLWIAIASLVILAVLRPAPVKTDRTEPEVEIIDPWQVARPERPRPPGPLPGNIWLGLADRYVPAHPTEPPARYRRKVDLRLSLPPGDRPIDVEHRRSG